MSARFADLPISMFGLNPSVRGEVAEQILKSVNTRLDECEEEISFHQFHYVELLMTMPTTAKNEKVDWCLTYTQTKIKKEKCEKQLFIAIKNHNWVLTDPFRKKLREIGDEMMELMEFGIEKGWYLERDYINNSNQLKNLLTESEKITETLKMWFAVIPTDQKQLKAWWLR